MASLKHHGPEGAFPYLPFQKAKRPSRWTYIVAFSITLLAITAFASTRIQEFGHSFENRELERPPGCAPAISSTPEATKDNIWDNLSIDEVVQIRRWLESPQLGLNLTKGDAAGITDNFVELVETYHPRKVLALSYYDSEGARPPRAARVVINRGGDEVPSVRNFVVSPLPISQYSRLQPLEDIYHRPIIPHNVRGVSTNDVLYGLFEDAVTGIEHVVSELLGGVFTGRTNDTLAVGPSGPWSFDGSFRRIWLQWKRATAGDFINPLNLYQYVDLSGTDKSLWKTLKLVYNNQIFNSKEEFVEAYNNKTLIIKVDPPINATWSSRLRKGPQRDLDDVAGPRSVSFDGLRFRVDKKQKYVTWMGWSFYLGFDRDMGLSLWNIKFLGDRIIYELAPQEALAQYTGGDPHQATTAWLDRFFGMGASVFEMIPGYDCPYDAIYLPATVHLSSGSSTNTRAICIFEKDSERPITRHRGMREGETGAVKGYVLTVRSISTVGNYDYRGYWKPSQARFGAPIYRRSMGTLHDHVINFKVDFDILGLNNSVLETSTEVRDVSFPWDEDWGSDIKQQTIVRRYITNEDEARLNYPRNFEGGYSIVNQDEKNAWGVPRGYSIHAGYSPIHNTVVGSKRMLNNANFAKTNLAFSKRKDTEPSASSAWNLHLPGAPPVDFDKFFDGENLEQEDIVAWINVGMHHFPEAEDSPNTRTNTAASSFFITPNNYHDYDVSIDSTNAVLLTEDEHEKWTANEYGVKASYCVPPKVAPLEYRNELQFDLEGTLVTEGRSTLREAHFAHSGMLHG